MDYDDKDLPIVNRNMRRLRIESKMTQKKIGDIIHLDHRTISGYENGLFEPGASVILEYCEFFHVTPNEILGFENKDELPDAVVATEEELQMVAGYRRRKVYMQDAIRSMCLNGATLLTLEEEISKEKEWLDNLSKEIEDDDERN